MQPSDLDGVGSYNISASVVSPAVNVLCVNMDADELAPIVYTSWPNAKKSLTGVGNQYQAWSSSWVDEVPAPANWTNTTVVDDIFNWHPTDPLLEINRSPPVFEMLPSDNNTVTYGSTQKDLFSTDSIYVLGKGFGMDNYTLCQMHSWPAIQCSTNFNVTGTTSMAMSADCSQSLDYFPENATLFTANPDAYVHTMNISDEYAVTKPDWRYMVQLWTLSMSLNSGNNNASIARILTQLALTSGELNSTLPSLAEALASLVANTLVTGAIDTPFIHYYSYNENAATGTRNGEFQGPRAESGVRVGAQRALAGHLLRGPGRGFHPQRAVPGVPLQSGLGQGLPRSDELVRDRDGADSRGWWGTGAVAHAGDGCV